MSTRRDVNSFELVAFRFRIMRCAESGGASTGWNRPLKLNLDYSGSMHPHILAFEKGGTLSEVPACGVMGMRAFGRGLPIGDSSNFVIETEKTGYWQNYQVDTREQLSG